MKMSKLFTLVLAAVIGFMSGCISASGTTEKVAASEKKAEETAKTAVKTTTAATKKAAAKKPAKKVEKTAAKKQAAKPAPKKLTLKEQTDAATTPVQHLRHAKRHAEKKVYAAANKDKIKILMLGDSITHQWEYKPAAAVNAKYITPYNVLNLGCGGDRTQHTIWIVEKSGILDLIKPQLVTLMIGTNNRYDYQATAAGIKRILDSVRKRYPEAKILLYAIFPRGKDNKNSLRKVNEKVNAEIVKYCNGKDIIWVDIRKDFLTPDGVLTKEMMPDLLHPRNAKGYSVWGESLKPYFEKYGK